jgi:hypothetical protein
MKNGAPFTFDVTVTDCANNSVNLNGHLEFEFAYTPSEFEIVRPIPLLRERERERDAIVHSRVSQTPPEPSSGEKGRNVKLNQRWRARVLGKTNPPERPYSLTLVATLARSKKVRRSSCRPWMLERLTCGAQLKQNVAVNVLEADVPSKVQVEYPGGQTFFEGIAGSCLDRVAVPPSPSYFDIDIFSLVIPLRSSHFLCRVVSCLTRWRTAEADRL